MATILIVDDEIAVAEVLNRFLMASGYSIATATSPSEALKYDQSFDLAILDVIMPEMSGAELAERLKKRSPNLKVLFMSGYIRDVILPEGAQLLNKPFTMTQAVEMVKKILEN